MACPCCTFRAGRVRVPDWIRDDPTFDCEAFERKAMARRLAECLVDPLLTYWPHYYSTYCIHGRHDECRRTCKTCTAPCLCPCHKDAPD